MSVEGLVFLHDKMFEDISLRHIWETPRLVRLKYMVLLREWQAQSWDHTEKGHTLWLRSSPLSR